MTGSATLPSVDVASLRGRSRDRPGRGARARKPGVCGHGRHPRHGGFSDYRIDADFTADRVSIERSNGKRPRGNFYLVQATNYRGLLLVDGQAGRIAVKAIIDTGAERDARATPRCATPSADARTRVVARNRVIGATGRRTSARRSSCRRCASAARGCATCTSRSATCTSFASGTSPRAGRADRHGPDRSAATLRRRLSTVGSPVDAVP